MKKLFNFKSWKTSVVILLLAIFFCSTISLFTTSYYYNIQVKNTNITENSYECEKWMIDVDVELRSMDDQIYDLLTTLYNNKEYSKNYDYIDIYTSAKIMDLMQNKTANNPDISAIFFYDANSDYYLYHVNPNGIFVRSIILKIELKNICFNNYSPPTDKSWLIKNIDGTDFFYKTLKMGRFIVGVISDCKQYKYSNFNTEKCSSYFIYDDKVVTVSDDYDFINLVDVNNLDAKYQNKKTIVSYKADISKIIGVIVNENILDSSVIISLLFVFNAVVCIVLIIVLVSIMKNRIIKPTSELIVATNEVSNGNIDYLMDVDKAGSQEFEEIYDRFNNMTKQIGDLKIKSYEMKLEEENNRLRMLRAQVKPHTFLNGITTISNLTYGDDPQKIRDYIYAFSQFTRYMLHTDSEWVTINEEIKHIENYVEMQKLKHPNTIELVCEVQEEIKNQNIPFLLMYSLVENSCKHAMDMVRPLKIKLTCLSYNEEGFTGIKITEEDDGDGFPEKVLNSFNSVGLNTKEHMGLTNVRYTLNLLYRRDDLLRLSNKEEGGAKVELLIPERENTNENTNM